MDKIERVTRAFKGEEVDHIPVCLWKGERFMEIRIPFLRWMESASARALFDPFAL